MVELSELISTPKPSAFVYCIAAATLALSAVLLFANLGHYALWDDEAVTALYGQGVWHTGDTNAIVGHNIVAYQGGFELKNGYARYLPPLQFFLAAPFTGPGGPSAFRARLPFALFGLATVAVLLHWLSRRSRDPLLWTLFCVALLCNVEFFLFSRQCRYYAPAIFFSVAIAYLYDSWDGRLPTRVLLSVAAFLLLTTNYVNFAAVMVCVTADYAIWGRRRKHITWKEAATVLVPVAVLGLPIVWIWNPLAVTADLIKDARPYFGKLVLLCWNLRDLNTNQFYSAGLVVIAVVLIALRRGSPQLARGVAALIIYIVIVTLVSPQQVESTNGAAVRYLTPILPLGVAIGAGVIARLSAKKFWIALPLAALAFGTNVLNGGCFTALDTDTPLTKQAFSSPIVSFVGELLHPPTDPYSVTAEWANANVQDSQSIWVYSEFEQLPLMYHAPQAVYARQLLWPPEPQFEGLAPIYFQGQGEPDFIIAFGPARYDMAKQVHFPPSVHYRLAARLDTYFRNLYRPELFWRSSTQRPVVDPNVESIYVFARVTSAG